MKKKICRFTEMKGYLFIVLFGIISILTFVSCSKGGTETDNGGGGPHVDTPNDVTPPVVSIFTPTINQVFTSGNVINITGRALLIFIAYQECIIQAKHLPFLEMN